MRFTFLTVFVLLFACAVASGGESGSTGVKGPPKVVLVDTDWLEKNLGSDKFRLIEVSSDPAIYDKGHIPGAVRLDWKQDLVDTANVNGKSPDIEAYKKISKRLGITDMTPVIFYGDSNNIYTTYAYWAFTTFAHLAPMKILDGGRKKWEAEKRPLTTEVPKFEAPDYVLQGTDLAVRADLEEVLGVVKQNLPGFLLDSRPADAFAGKVTEPPAPAGEPQKEDAPKEDKPKFARAGHILRAANVPISEAYLEDGTFKSSVLLQAIFDKAGVVDTVPVYPYDWTHVTSAHHWFVLRMILNYSDVRMYNGAWQEYSNGTGAIGPVPKKDEPKP